MHGLNIDLIIHRLLAVALAPRIMIFNVDINHPIPSIKGYYFPYWVEHDDTVQMLRKAQKMKIHDRPM